MFQQINQYAGGLWYRILLAEKALFFTIAESNYQYCPKRRLYKDPVSAHILKQKEGLL